MALIKFRLGNYINLYSEKCNNPNLTIWDISGINSDKEFFEPSKQAGADTSNYKVVPPDYFACNLMHVGRDEVLPIALNHTEHNKIVSPAYTVFNIKNDAPILKEYFFIMLKSSERDRYFWFHTDSSVAKIDSDLSLEHNVTVSVTVKLLEQFTRFAEISPFYRNVINEGICHAGN